MAGCRIALILPTGGKCSTTDDFFYSHPFVLKIEQVGLVSGIIGADVIPRITVRFGVLRQVSTKLQNQSKIVGAHKYSCK
jgi:hypothetical protein